MKHPSGTIDSDADSAKLSDRVPKCAILLSKLTESSEFYERSEVIEIALARALVLAAEARR